MKSINNRSRLLVLKKVAVLPVILLTGFIATEAHANRFGLGSGDNATGRTGLTCAQSGCHTSGQNYNSSLTFSGETTVTPGSLNDVSLILSFRPPSNVSSPVAGFQAELSDSDASLIPGEQQKNDAIGRLTHTSPQFTSNNTATFTFQWQAPEVEGSVTLFACSQPANNDFFQTGDDASPACIEQVFTVAEEEPTEPPVEPTSFVAYDYDGDGLADVGVRRPSTQLQYISNSSDGEIQRHQFGRNSADIPVSGDFDGDGIADVAVRRPSTHFWYIQNSSDGEIQRIQFGRNENDIPVPADFDGDGITDVAVRRASNQFWYILNSSDGEIQRYNFGKQEGDIPVPADYDGDGIADVAVRRPSNFTWYILRSSDGEIDRIVFGRDQDDIPVPADYDGDGKADVAVRRASNQFFYILNSSDGEIQRINFGKQSQDVPIVADYDGDGKADVAVRRPSTQFQYILRSSDGLIERIQFGRQSTDVPLAGPVLQRMQMVTEANMAERQVAEEAAEWWDMDFIQVEPEQ